MKSLYRLFLVYFSIPVLAAFLVALPNLVFFAQVGERANGAQIAHMLAENKQCLYGRASLLAAAEPAFKFEQYGLLKPQIVAVGSSRSMQFVQDYFMVPFFTFGGVNHTVDDVIRTVDQAMAAHKPDFIILQLDYWWFNTAYTHGTQQKRRSVQDVVSTYFKQVFEPYFWVHEGKITPDDYRGGIARSYRAAVPCRIGLNARKNSEGYEKDGSYFYGSGYMTPNEAKGFENNNDDIDRGRFFYGGAPDAFAADRLERLHDLLRKLDDAGVAYAIVLPPVAPDIYQRLREKQPDNIAFIAAVAARLKTLGADVYDFQDPANLKASNCEFVDEVHGGQIAYARILAAMTTIPALRPYLAQETIARDIKAYTGHTVSGERLLRYMDDGAKETDFLNLGCRK